MSIPITKRVMVAGSKKGCGCPSSCSCGKAPAKKALKGDQDTLPIAIQKEILAAPETAAKMWGPAKRKYGADAVAKKRGCGMKY